MIPPEGFSAKIKDNRIDRIAKQRGYKRFETFYSPISMVLVFIVLICATAAPFLFEYYYYIIDYYYYALLYGTFFYFGATYLNNSFVIAENDFLIINPNLPFTHITCYKIQEIQKIKIGCEKWYFPSSLVLQSGNFVEVQTKNKTKKYYCGSLEIDSYDENLTEKTLDDLHCSLSNKGILVEFSAD